MSERCKHGKLPDNPCWECDEEHKGYTSSLVQAPGSEIDANVQSVRRKMLIRAERGLSKYGVTTERTDLDALQWLQHAQDEAMDLAVYLERLMADIRRRMDSPNTERTDRRGGGSVAWRVRALDGVMRMKDIWKDPSVKGALKQGRSPDDIMVMACPQCGEWGYYNQGSHFYCRHC